MKKYAVIVAGGSGTRMQSATPKQFLELNGKPVIMHTLERFWEASTEIKLILVLPELHVSFWNELLQKHRFVIPHVIVKGGETRFQSVRNGLQVISGEGLVAVHDAVRPLITPALINRLIENASIYGNAVPVIPVSETIRIVEGDSSKTVDRTKFRLVQTPQVFKVSELQEAFKKPYQEFFTDEATIMESSDHTIYLSEGEVANIKITTPSDLAFATAYLK